MPVPRVRLETRGKASLKEAPVRSPTSPPIKDILWEVGWASAPVTQNVPWARFQKDSYRSASYPWGQLASDRRCHEVSTGGRGEPVTPMGFNRERTAWRASTSPSATSSASSAWQAAGVSGWRTSNVDLRWGEMIWAGGRISAWRSLTPCWALARAPPIPILSISTGVEAPPMTNVEDHPMDAYS